MSYNRDRWLGCLRIAGVTDEQVRWFMEQSMHSPSILNTTPPGQRPSQGASKQLSPTIVSEARWLLAKIREAGTDAEAYSRITEAMGRVQQKAWDATDEKWREIMKSGERAP